MLGVAVYAVSPRVRRNGASFEYQGLVHRAGSLFDESWFEHADENAIVDFKYSPSPRVTWWFDHHLVGVSDTGG